MKRAPAAMGTLGGSYHNLQVRPSSLASAVLCAPPGVLFHQESSELHSTLACPIQAECVSSIVLAALVPATC